MPSVPCFPLSEEMEICYSKQSPQVVKRDFEIYKQILAHLEGCPTATAAFAVQPPMEKALVDEHLLLMQDANLIQKKGNVRGRDGESLDLYRITHAGHDFLANSKDEVAWAKAKEKAGGFGYDVFKEVLKEAIIVAIKTSLGIA